MVSIDPNSGAAGIVRDQRHQRTLHPCGRRGAVAAFPLSTTRWLDDGDSGILREFEFHGRTLKIYNSIVQENADHAPGIRVPPALLAVKARFRATSGGESAAPSLQGPAAPQALRLT